MAKVLRVRNVILVLVVLLIALVALGPTLLGPGPGKAFLAAKVANRVDGTVAIDRARLSWFGDQRLEGLRIRDETGREAANVNVTVGRGLVSLLLGPDEVLPVALSGRLAGELREDGSTSFQDLVAGGEPDAGGGAAATPAPDKEAAPFTLDVRPFALDLADLVVVLDLAGTTPPRALSLDDVHGHVHYQAGGKLDAKLATPTTSGPLRGQIDVAASAADLFDAQGVMRPDGATVSANVTTQSLPVPFADDVEELRQLVLTVATANLAQTLDVTVHAETRLVGAEPSVLDGTLAFAAPVTPQGAIRVGLDTVRGELTGRRVPTALLQPALAGKPIVLARDVGPSVDVTAGFAPIEGDAGRTDVTVALTAQHATLDLEAAVGADGAITGRRLVAKASVPPALAGGRLAAPAPVTLELESFSLPPRGADGALPVERIALAGAVTVPGTVPLVFAAETEPLAVEGTRVTFSSPALGEGVALDGGATVAGSAATLKATAAFAEGAVRVDAATIGLTATPALVAALQAGDEDPVELLAPSAATLALEPFALSGDRIAGHLTVGRADVRTAAVPEALRVADLKIDFTLGRDETTPHAAVAGAVLRRVNGDARLGRLAGDVTVERGAETLWPRGTVGIEEIAVAELAALLGHEPATATGWLGSTGTVALVLGGTAASRDVTVRTDLPNLRGELRAALANDTLEVTAEDLRLTLAQGVLEKALAPEPAPDAGAPAEPVRVRGDVPFTVALERVTVPMAMIRKEPFDPAAFALDATLTGGPLVLVHPGDVVSRFAKMGVTLASSDLAEGVRFTAKGTAAGGARGVSEGGPETGAGRSGGFSVEGTVTGLVTEQSTFTADGAALTTEGTVDRVPTSIGDAFLGMEGLLVAAVGEEMSAAFRSNRFSRRDGWIDGRIDAPQGFVEARLRGHENALRTSKTRSLRGELALTPAFREQLLAPIHPILRDIRTTEQPIRFSVGDGAWLPLDGDMSRLKADFEITIGTVEFDSGSTMLGLMSLFSTPKPVIPGSIAPIVGKIRDGIVEYDRFVVRIDQYELAYTGRVDLAKRTLALRTELPLKALGTSFQELEGYTDKIVVPLVTRGTFAKHKTEIDPEFDLAGAAIEAGFTGALDEALKGTEGEGLGKLFGDLLGGEKKKSAPKRQPEKKDGP